MLQIYNTLNRRKEDFVPVNEKEVKMYVCGPTTYNYFHIGNGRAFLFFDVVRRYLKYIGYKVTYVQNITDIDDKIIAQSIAEGKPIEEISKKYIEAFYDDIKVLEVSEADHYPKATEYVVRMRDFIGQLVEKGFAYESGGDVFFSVDSMKDYGKLSGKKIDDLISGARVGENSNKRSPGDFVLWKRAKPGEPKWDSPWGEGRPGWHTECVVMSQDLLAETFDIHSGGSDLVFPHHENELAQAEAATGKLLANFWMHNGFVNIEGEKMSKSLNNFLTVRDILKKYPAEAVRHFYLSKHYRSPIDFSENAIIESNSALKKLYAPFKELTKEELSAIKVRKVIPEYKSDFIAAMNDDFNTAKAVALLFDLIKELKNVQDPDHRETVLQTLLTLGGILGFYQHLDLKLVQPTNNGLSDRLIELLVEYRNRFKAEKRWDDADMIRNDLKEIGIMLQDTPEGTKWLQE